MPTLKGFTYNNEDSTRPWGGIEGQAWEDNINTLVGDSDTGAANTAGHGHWRLKDNTSQDDQIRVHADYVVVPSLATDSTDEFVMTNTSGQLTKSGQGLIAQGDTGVAGDTGVQGIQGDTGVAGIQGETGVAGIQGDTGVAGIQGDTGVAGIQGNTGVQGIQGETGVQGTQGETGAAGINGVTGVAGIQGDTGVAGVAGETGIAGIQGETGVAGIQGDTGAAGIAGETGVAGVTGVAGIQGVTGITEYNKVGLTIESPTATEDVTIMKTNDAITIRNIESVMVGSDTTSIDWTLRYDSDRDAAGTEVVTGGSHTTSDTTGDSVTVFNEATIDATNWLWLETTDTSGTSIDSFNVTIWY